MISMKSKQIRVKADLVVELDKLKESLGLKNYSQLVALLVGAFELYQVQRDVIKLVSGLSGCHVDKVRDRLGVLLSELYVKYNVGGDLVG